MDKEKENFLKGAQKVGVSDKIAAEVFDLMAAFAGYGFNKSHSAAYGLLTYQTAYLKHHYPHEFMASLLSCDKDDIDKVVKNIDEAKTMGLNIQRPDVNQSESNFTVSRLPALEKSAETKSVIRFGLSAIRGVGEAAVEALVEARQQAPFRSLFSLCEQVDLRRVNKKALDSLIKAGALDEIIPSRAKALASMEAAVERAQKIQREKESGQTSLFGLLATQPGLGTVAEPEPAYPDLEEFPLQQTLAYEKEALGFYVSGHPLDRYQKDLKRTHAKRLSALDSLPDRTDILVGGMVTDYRERPLKSGNGRMAFFHLDDGSGFIEVICFSKPFVDAEALLKMNEPLLLSGTLVTEGEGEAQVRKLHLKEARLLSEWRMQKTSAIVIECVADDLTKEKLKLMEQAMKKHPGGIPIRLRLRHPGHWQVDAELPLHYRVLPSEKLLEILENLCGAEAVSLL